MDVLTDKRALAPFDIADKSLMVGHFFFSSLCLLNISSLFVPIYGH
jgi:hypothetical protein